MEDTSKLSLAELRHRFQESEDSWPVGWINALRADPRKGAQALVERWEERQKREQAETARLQNLLHWERQLWNRGVIHIAGVDEAGVAPLAGPVVAAACILPHDFCPRGINDSKKLDREKRESLEKEIKQKAVAWSIGMATAGEIDSLNIYQASLLAMKRAVDGLAVLPNHVLVDARTIPDISMTQQGIIQGDAISLTIAAASILAKTARDKMLGELAKKYPGYGFEKHKGYPTPEHCVALQRLGACPEHRTSFAPVSKVLGSEHKQMELPLKPLPVCGENGS